MSVFIVWARRPDRGSAAACLFRGARTRVLSTASLGVIMFCGAQTSASSRSATATSPASASSRRASAALTTAPRSRARTSRARRSSRPSSRQAQVGRAVELLYFFGIVLRLRTSTRDSHYVPPYMTLSLPA